MKPISSNLIESLKTLGLTEYEAKVYATLVLFDRAEVKQVYEYLDMPKPSAYQSLKMLMDKGLVQVVNAKPAVYRATPPDVAIRHMTEVHRKAEDAALRELEELEKSRVLPETPDILWTLYGEENVEHMIEELLTKARRSARLMLPDDYMHYLEFLRDREIDIELITFGGDRTIPERYGLKHATVRDARGLDATDLAPFMKYFSRLPLPPENFNMFIFLLIDDEEMMYIPPFPAPTKSGITSRNPFVCALGNMVFQILRDRMPIVYPEQHLPWHHV
jgi:predicted transcriptional regulator